MTRRPKVLAIVQAGGQGSRMDVLTRERAKPALPYAGQYQLVDFGLSSAAHSGVTDVWLSVQYLATSLHKHVAAGRPWDLDRTRGGLQWLPPEEGSGSAAQSGFSEGNGDDLYRNLDGIRDFGADVVERYLALTGPTEVLWSHRVAEDERRFAIFNNMVFVSRKTVP